LVNKFRINRREFDHPFTISSQALSNGPHTLRVEAVNGTYRKNKTIDDRVFNVDNVPLQAAFVRQDSEPKVFQGRTLHLQFQTNKEIKTAQVKTLAKSFDCVPESAHSSVYEAFIPISCEENPNEYLLTVDIEDKVGTRQTLENKFQVIAYPFKKQSLTFDPLAIKREEEAGLGQQELKEKLEAIVAQSPKEKMWQGRFCVPLDMTMVTCDFGTIRTTKEKGRYMHKALDLGARKKSVIWASQNGIVALKERYAQTGNTVVIDHGCGITSMYCHLDSFANIEVGQRIEKGNPVGIMGKTGFATGDHLHWEMMVDSIAVDPMQWTKNNF
jgi:murein DD-endopeptidase MepM/ murein hydrolase activator NlpD